MDNRRDNNTNTEKPFDRNKYQKRDDDNRNTGQPRREGSFQGRDDRPRQNDDRPSQPRDNRFQPRVNTGQPRTNNNQPRVTNNQPRDGRFPPRDNRFQSDNRTDNRNQPRDNRDTRDSRDNRDNRTNTNSSGRFERKDDGFPRREGGYQGKPNNFDPKKRFPSKGKPAESWKQPVIPKIVSEMQLTDGKHAGQYLKSTTSPKVRLTTRKLREAMFKIVMRRVRGGRFLDLCAGSGAVGLEAISRGALLGTFVERSAKMCSFIKKNMESLSIKEGHGELFEIEVVPFLMRMQKRRRFWDVVFLDPPYDANYDEILALLSRGVTIKPKGVLIIEHHTEMFFPEKLGVLTRMRVVVEGDSSLSFYERK